MRLKIDIEIPHRAAEALKYAVPALVVLATGLAYAALPHTFTAGETLRAADLNANLTNLDTRVTQLAGQPRTYAAEISMDSQGLWSITNQVPAAWLTLTNGTPTKGNPCSAGGGYQYFNTLALSFAPFASAPVCSPAGGGNQGYSGANIYNVTERAVQLDLKQYCPGVRLAITCVAP